MAAKESSLVDDFICHLCLLPYRCPKALPCLHTFCSKCLEDYISSCEAKIGPGSCIRCPLCKKGVYGRVGQDFPANFHVANMMKKLNILSEERCGLCREDQGGSHATRWCRECRLALCRDCVESHRQLRVTAHHLVVELEEAEKTCSLQQFLSEPPCPRHWQEPLRSYCGDCRRAICHRCLLDEHMRCQKVTLAREAVLARAEEAGRMMDELNRWTESGARMLETIEERRERCLRSKEGVVADIRRSTWALMEEFHRKGEALVAEVDSFYALEDDGLKALLEECAEEKMLFEQTRRLFQLSLKSENSSQFLEIFEWSRLNLPSEVDLLEQLSLRLENARRMFRFDESREFLEGVDRLRRSDLGEVTLTTDRFTEVGGRPETESFAVPRHLTATRSPEDRPPTPQTSDCWPFFLDRRRRRRRGSSPQPGFPECVVMLSQGETFLIDWTRRTLKRNY